eukprot:TRINITY_DN26207_c0_g1_i1.p1 TRINITY_DN26207_c0_g1~~TRINITY_DN26207_c0_g1_i1.p1  ORF type:complete len:1311 (+),score=206.85 TRINITY_DN26207_c0_g1_i1:130-4062(+)
MRTRNESAREPMLEAGEAASEEASQQTRVGTLGLYREATRSEKFLLFVSALAACAQGATAPLLSLFMQDLLTGIFYPNDDLTMPPKKGPHTTRDHKVWYGVSVFLYLAAVSLATSLVSFYGFAIAADRMTLRLKTRFFEKLLEKDVGWYDLNSAAEMSTRLTNDTYEYREGVGEKFARLLMAVVMFPVAFVVAFTKDWRLTLIMMAVVPFMALAFGVAQKVMARSAAMQQEVYAKAGGLAEASISSIRTIAAFQGYERALASYDKQLANGQRRGTRAGWANGISTGFAQLAVYSSISLGFYAGSILVISDYEKDCWKSDPPFGTCFTGATMLSCIFAIMLAAGSLAMLAPGLAAFTSAKGAAGRIYQVIDAPPAFNAESGRKLDAIVGTVEFKNVVFSYPSRPDGVALNGVSFVVPSGKTTAFVGPSGSGKSTCIQLLQRYYDPKSGGVFVDGHNIQDLSLRWLRSHMALVQQEPILFSGSIRENISYGKEGSTTIEEVEAAGRAANAHTFIHDFPKNYETEVGERGAQLSGGQKQRIAIARAIIRDPAILLLDEATSALDNESERIVQKALDALLAGGSRTTMVIAHRLSTIQNADQIIVLDNGTLIERGTHADLVGTPGSLYGQLLELQKITSDGDIAAQKKTMSRTFSRATSGGCDESLVPMSRSTSQQEPLAHRQLSQQLIMAHSITDLSVHGENTEADGLETGQEESGQPVPTARVWTVLDKSDLCWVALALLATIPAGACRPLQGRLFGDITNLFSQPPATLSFDSFPPRWVGNLDVDEMRSSTNKKCLIFVLIGCLMFVSTAGQQGGFRKSSEALIRRIRCMTFRAMLRQEMGWFDVRLSGVLADRLASEAPLIKAFTGEQLASLLQLFVTLLTGLGLAFQASWKLTLCCIGFVPVLALGTAAQMRLIRKTNETRAGPIVSEAMTHVRTVAAFGLERRMEERYLRLLEGERQKAQKESLGQGIANAWSQSANYLLFAIVFLLSNMFINNAWIEPSDTLDVLFPVLFAATGAAIASQWQADKAKAQKAVNNIFHTVDRVPEIDAYDTLGEKPGKLSGRIEFQHVAFNYPSRPNIPVFVDFDLEIEPGTTVAFCGPSGSGKSTTIALLQRFYNPLRGAVLLDGKDIRCLNLAWLRSQMALVQQEPILFDGSILDNIAYGREGASEQECIEAAKSANAHSFIEAFPDGYRTEVGERGSQLSGGQKQRIAIARSMIRNPTVLLLDEATSALDTESERVVQEALDKLLIESRRTTLVIAHRLSTIVSSDVICVIYQGKIVEKGTHAELMKIQDGQYRQLATRQEKEVG